MSVSGVYDPQLAAPIDVSALPPGTSSNTNVYGVPWIIGAKKGFPAFNEFAMQNVVQVSRKVQLSRQSLTDRPSTFQTNQIFAMSVSNSITVEFWNSYDSNYVSSITNGINVVVNDNISMTLTNDNGGPQPLITVFPTPYFMVGATNLTVWPGSAPWYSDPLNGQPESSSFIVPFNTTVVLLTNSVYSFVSGNFIPPSLVSTSFSSMGILTLPQFGLLTSNRLQVFILDGSHVIDYAHFNGPNSSRNLNQEIGDFTINGSGLWHTNRGIYNQVIYSMNPQASASAALALDDSGVWGNSSSGGTIGYEIAYFDAFFHNASHIGSGTDPNTGIIYTATNLDLSAQAPFIPIRIVYEYSSWQVNDPFVHYLASDLEFSDQDSTPPTGINQWNSLGASLPRPLLATLNQRYQPWGKIHIYPNSDANAFNLTYKDPLVWQSDDWNFPSTNNLPLATLGQIHRGTPWQTVYLKASNLLAETINGGYVGTNTWTNWTGDANPMDAAISAPVADWRLASLLANFFNTNDATQLISVNDPNTADWLNVLNGISVQTNSAPSPSYYAAPQLDPFIMSSNSPQATVIANAIAQNRFNQPGQMFGFAGDILASPQLADASPWLNTGSPAQIDYAISDEAYEAIPSQLLPLLRPDSVGAIIQTNGNFSVQFSGSDGLTYVFQASANLVNWKSISTNCPVQGTFIVPLPPFSNLQNQFYRSILLP
jgi:hypothetical protein